MLGAVFTHIHFACLNPDGIMYNPIHDGIGVDASAQAAMPVLFPILRTEDSGCAVMPPFNELEQEMLLILGYAFKQPFVNNQHPIAAVFLQQLGIGFQGKRCFIMLNQKIRKADISGADLLLAGLTTDCTSKEGLSRSCEALKYDIGITVDELPGGQFLNGIPVNAVNATLKIGQIPVKK